MFTSEFGSSKAGFDNWSYDRVVKPVLFLIISMNACVYNVSHD